MAGDETVVGAGPARSGVRWIAGLCTAVGAVAFTTVRLLHGDTPAADPTAALAFVAARPSYAAVHVGAVFAALLGVVGLVALVGTLREPVAQLLGRVGLGAALVGLAVFAVEGPAEGLALQELSRGWASAAAGEREGTVAAARAVLAVTHGPSLVAIALLYGAALLAIGVAAIRDAAPSWLGWSGVGVGATTLVAAVVEYLAPDSMPGVIVYGLLASIVAQLWLLALAVVLLRSARGPQAL